MIDENHIKKNLNMFSFPRLSGTKGERISFNKIKTIIESYNLKPFIQNFSFSTFYSRIYPKLAFSSVFWLIFVLFLNIEGIFTFLNLLITSFFMIFLFIITRKPENIRLGRKFNSQNVYVTMNSSLNRGNERKIMFFSHIDSKGQRLTILTRIYSINLWIYSILISLLIIILKNIIFIQFNTLFLIIGIFPISLNLFATVLIDINSTNNYSDGALDNASGLTCVLSLLNFYVNQENRPKNYDLWFVFTGAEESGTMGIRYIYKTIKNFNREKTIIMNFDAVGKSVCAFAGKKSRKRNKTFYDTLINNGKKKKFIKDVKIRTLGAHSDGYYLKKQDFSGVGWGDMETYKYVHSRNDTIDKVDSKLLKNLCELIINSIKKIDDQI